MIKTNGHVTTKVINATPESPQTPRNALLKMYAGVTKFLSFRFTEPRKRPERNEGERENDYRLESCVGREGL